MNDIVSEPFPLCLLCSRPTSEDNVCRACTQDGIIDSAWICGARETALKEVLDRYKFDSTREAAKVCVWLLDEILPVLPAAVTVMAVPTASARVRSRGYDHTKLIAKSFARTRGLPYKQTLERTNHQVQHFKSRKQRLESAALSFRSLTTSPETVLLVDDIYTTGSTISACAALLRENGAKYVYVAIIARQTLDEPGDL